MKNLYILLLIIVTSIRGFTQTITIDVETGGTTPIPEKVYWYEFKEPAGWSTNFCNYNWSTSGQAVFTTSDGNSAGSSWDKRVYIKWLNSVLNDHPDGRTVTVTVSGCDSTALNVTKNLTVNTKYLPPPTFKTSGGSTITTLNVSCYAPEINLRLESIPDAEYYRWELPAGWSKKGSPGVNLFSTTTPTVDVTVGQGVATTSIKAYASIASFNGPSTTLPVTRNADPISFTGTNPTVYCSSNKPVSYSVANVAGLSYSWTYPAGWTCQSGCTSSTITLVPDGSNVQGQSVTARGSIACASQTVQTNIASQPISFSTAFSPDFTISSPYAICIGGTAVSLAYVSSNTPVNWAPSSNITLVSGQGTPTAIVKAASASRASGTINATVTACTSGSVPPKTVWVGSPLLAATYSNGDMVKFTNSGNPVSYNEVSNLIQKKVDMVSLGAGGSWQRIAANPTNTDWSASNNRLSFYFFQAGQTATFRYSATNGCGTTAQDYSFRSKSSGGGGGCNQFAVSPNPSQNIINIEAPLPNIPAPCPDYSVASTEAAKQAESNHSIQSIRLYDTNGQLMRSKEFPVDTKTADIDISDLRKGIYILRILNGAYLEEHRIIKE